MRKLLAYPLTCIFYLCFGLSLLIFHPIFWFTHRFLGYTAFQKSVNILQFFIMRSLNVLGYRFTFTNPYDIPEGVPIIIVSNHQSMYDIPPIIWYFRKYHPKFISKKELGKGIPSVSYNLRHGGSALIDRKDSAQAIASIKNFSQYIKETKRAAVIFPEGTRSVTGVPKKFQRKGLHTIFNAIPEAIVVPLTINNSWKTLRYGMFPMEIGVHLSFKTHQPIALKDYEDKTELIDHIEQTIIADIKL